MERKKLNFQNQNIKSKGENENGKTNKAREVARDSRLF